MRGRGLVACVASAASVALASVAAACTFGVSTEGIFAKEDPGGTSSSGAGSSSGGSSSGGSTTDGSTVDQDSGPGTGDAGSTYRAAVLADGPIGYWRLGDPVAPTARDETTGGRDGTYLGGVKLGVPGAPAGDVDTAADFDGTDDRVRVTLPASFEFVGKATFSVEAWIKRTDAVTGGLSKGHYDAGYAGWYMVYNGSQAETFQFFRSGSSPVSTNAPPDNAWFHAVATFDGFTLLLYVNGVEVASNTNVQDLQSSPEPLSIGAPTYWGAHKGAIDEVAIYDKPLSPARVKAHYDAAQPK